MYTVHFYFDVFEIAPLEVLVHPTSQNVAALSRVEFECSFKNAIRFQWYKDNRVVSSSDDVSPLIINPALPEDQGYYFCRGYDEDAAHLDTSVALLIIMGKHSFTKCFVRFRILFIPN